MSDSLYHLTIFRKLFVVIFKNHQCTLDYFDRKNYFFCRCRNDVTNEAIQCKIRQFVWVFYTENKGGNVITPFFIKCII